MKKDYYVELNENEKTFFLKKDNKKVGHLIYELNENNIMNLISTKVDPSLKGKGLAIDLIKESVNYAREKNYKIDATCPYAILMLKRNKEDFKDVIAKDFNA